MTGINRLLAAAFTAALLAACGAPGEKEIGEQGPGPGPNGGQVDQSSFAFRTEQNTVTSLDNWGVNVNKIGTTLTDKVCNFWVHP